VDTLPVVAARGTVGGPKTWDGGRRRLALTHADPPHAQNETVTVLPLADQPSFTHTIGLYKAEGVGFEPTRDLTAS
jgi:hypothetical protein